MKHIIFLSVLLALGCATSPEKREQRKGWTDGKEHQRSFQEQQRQEQQETIRDQNPSLRPNF